MNPTSLSHHLRAFLILAVLLVSATAGAQTFEELSDDDKRRLIQLLSAGNAAFDRGDHEEACETYQEAADMAEFPEVYYRLATCRERLDELEEAIAAYETYLEMEPDARDRQRIEREMERLEQLVAARSRALLKITSEPVGSVVHDADGQELGPTPLELELTPGEHLFTLEHEGYRPFPREIELEGGDSREIHIDLERIARLRVISDPEGAQVQNKETGEPLGTTPLSMEVEPGEYHLVLTLRNAPPQERQVVVERGQWVDLDVTMLRDEGSRWQGRVGMTSLGLSALAGVGSGVLWYMTEEKIAAANGYSRSHPDHSRAELQDMERDALQFRQYTLITMASAGALFVVGGTFLILQRGRSVANENSMSLDLSFTDGGAYGAVRFDF